MTPRLAAAAALTAVLATACGSTASTTGIGRTAGPASGGLDMPSGESAPGSPDILDPPALTGGDANVGSGGTGDGSTGAASATSGNVTTGSGTSTGVRRPVQVGFQITGNNASTANSLGFSGINNGDERSVVQALVTTANASGGLAGHRIEPVFFEVDPTTTATYDELGQQACSRFTEDTHVTAVATTSFFTTLATCLARRGVPGVGGTSQMAFSPSDLKAMPTIATFGLSPQRQAAAIVDTAARQHYFTDRPRVGVVTVDVPRFRDAVPGLLRGLRANGAAVDDADVVYSPYLQRTSDLSTLTASMQSAVLRFRSDDVTHVVFLQEYAAPALLFMQQADSQRASFRYALSSPDAPQVLVTNGVSTRQLAGAVAAGWDAYLDVAPSKAGAPPAGRAWCLRALAKLGLVRGSNAEWIAFMHCDAVAALLTAARQVSDRLTSGSLAAALGRVGDIPSANIPAARITTDHRWAVAGYRLNRFDAECGCFAYASRTVVPV